MRLLLLIVLCFLATASFSQEKSATDSLQNEPPVHSADSTEAENTAVPGTKAGAEATSTTNSADTTNTSKTDSLQQIKESKLTTKLDSIPSDSLQQFQNKLQNLQGFTINPGDSLKSKNTGSVKDSLSAEVAEINNKPAALQSNLDSAQSNVTEVLNQKSQKAINGITGTATDSAKVVSQSQEKLQTFQSKQQEKLNKVTDGKLPDSAMGEHNPLNKVSEGIPSTEIGKTGTDIPEVDGVELPTDGLKGTELSELNAHELGVGEDANISLPETDNLTKDIIPTDIGEEIKELDVKGKAGKLSEVNVDGLKEDPLGKTQELSGKSLEQVKDVEELESVTESVDGVKEVSGKAGEYSENLKAVKAGDTEALEKRAEEHVGGIKEIDELKAQIAETEALQKQYENQIKELRAQQDMELFKEKLDEKLKEKSVNHFSGNMNNLLAAQGSLLKYKQKYPNVKSIKDIKKESAAERMNRSFVERLVFGLDMQIVNRNELGFLDLAPYVGYKITHRLEVYGGYVWRYHINLNDGLNINRRNVYGARGSVNYLVYKGFSAVGSYERIYRKPLPGFNETGKVWHNGVFLGISKKYKITKGFYGNGQFLYNATYQNDGPYRKRLAVRFGFFLDLKHNKKAKKEAEEKQ